MASGTEPRPIALSTADTSQTVSGVTIRYRTYGQLCIVTIGGAPTTTDTIQFTGLPQAIMGYHETHGQWGNSSNQVQIWIDDLSTTLSIRNHTTNNMNDTVMYICV